MLYKNACQHYMLQKKHVNMHSTCMLHNSRHACCANQDEINHVALTCARMSRAERVVYWYTFSNPYTNNAPGRLLHTVISFIHLSGLSSFSFSANLLTIFIPSFVFPHLIYHICNLYRGLPLPSPSLLSATADGFSAPTLTRPIGPIDGFTGHLNV